ncbi:MAG: multiple sugar transport system substrate-binding protein [Candidatus Atribacteria bacterium]|nr:multiple sugar transport system substrate-binding protein [Candidatus Atribacteria bacterium]
MKRSSMFLVIALAVVLVLTWGFLALAQEETSELELQTAEAAFQAADKGNPDPAWQGQKFTIGVYSAGPRGAISGPLYFWRPFFEKLTGATYDIVEIPFGELREKIFIDLMTGTGYYDVIIGPSWFYGDYVSNGWIVPIDKYFDDPRMPKWDRDSILLPIRELLQWKGTWYGFNNDHDGQVLYYRRDILTDPKWQELFKQEKGYDLPVPPRTWEEVYDVCDFFNGKDWNGDGEKDYGITMHLKVGGQGFFHFMALSAPYVVSPAPGDDPTKVTRYHNVYWFDPETMEPLVDTPGFVEALKMLLKLSKTGPSAMWGWSLGEAWDAFLRGKAVLTFSWGDVGSLSQLPESSNIKGKLGVAPIPGSEKYYDLETQQWVNQRNFVANTVGASWHGVISKFSKKQDLAAYFLSWQATPEINHWNVVWGWTGIDPGTLYDLLKPTGYADIEDYVQTGYDAEDARQFVTAYEEMWYKYPLRQAYLRIPGTPEYWEVWDIHLSEAVVGQVSPEEALRRTKEDWNAITDRLGRENQKKIYQEAIGYIPEK